MTGTIDVRRVLRIAAVLLFIVTASLIYFSFSSDVDAASQRVDRAEYQLDSDRSTSYRFEALRRERALLSQRFDRLFSQNAEAVFLRGLSSDVARHGLMLVSTSESRETVAQNGEGTALEVQMRGTYPNLLAAIGELSLGPEIVRVDPPTLRRDGSAITATVPVTIFDPAAHALADGTAP